MELEERPRRHRSLIKKWDSHDAYRGTSISCPFIEKALTSDSYSDRVLGATEQRTVSPTAIHVFNGNNVSPRGDLASRSLIARLAVNRPDPENREFKHPEPIEWTESNRGRILKALYTILLGNPRLRSGDRSPAETRFKEWYHLIGSAIEHAARQHATFNADAAPISFRRLFLDSEAEEEQSDALATVLHTLRSNWPDGFKAADVSGFITNDDEVGEFKAAIEDAAGKPILVISPKVISWRLKALKDAPVDIDGEVLMLKYAQDNTRHGGDFWVEVVRS